MAIIPHQDADRLLAECIKNILFSLYLELIKDLFPNVVNKLIRSAIGPDGDPFQIVEFSGDAIASDPMNLIDEANAINMFGGTVAYSRHSRQSVLFARSLNLLPKLRPSMHDCS